MLKFSIITVTYNSAGTILNCLLSVNTQKYPELEHIVVDNQSTDDTLAIVKSHGKRVSRIITEPDRGIYDAMNKGIDHANGEVIGFLHSDDAYADGEVIREVGEMMTRTGADALYADLCYVRPECPERVFRCWKTGEFVPGSFARGWHLPHPTFFVKREVYQSLGTYNTTLPISADFELTLRFLEKNRLSTCYLPRSIVKMRHGGASTGTLKNIIVGNLECYKAFGMNGIPVSPLYFLYRSWLKALEFWRRGEIN